MNHISVQLEFVRRNKKGGRRQPLPVEEEDC
jgi:hypothetical protein